MKKIKHTLIRLAIIYDDGHFLTIYTLDNDVAVNKASLRVDENSADVER